MTASEAAKACMEVADGIVYWDDFAREIVEREFAEIISRVTTPRTDKPLGSTGSSPKTRGSAQAQLPGPVTHGGEAHYLNPSQAGSRRSFIPAGISIPRNEDEVRNEVLAEP